MMIGLLFQKEEPIRISSTKPKQKGKPRRDPSQNIAPISRQIDKSVSPTHFINFKYHLKSIGFKQSYLEKCSLKPSTDSLTLLCKRPAITTIQPYLKILSSTPPQLNFKPHQFELCRIAWLCRRPLARSKKLCTAG